ncbi:hypothetical protein KIH39_07315 [Telmatocola sphagniphila]|uniref:Uncharacterized protein n=1 Tax=Telmatocola sphagniphila TaxID=1123043 RepID=A0A8E6BAR6_9BACT|nr:hypothetical protein [Telmatocola sphagniphila]QVL33708.1 hypothetical protein KIH39_07315 [Telmatocola sphagniphila]
MFGDIQSKRLLYAKGLLFVMTGTMAFAILLVLHPSWEVALLQLIAIWSFARAYYFAFYVIEHYVDPGYKFAGLGSFVRYVLAKKKSEGETSLPKGNNPDSDGL